MKCVLTVLKMCQIKCVLAGLKMCQMKRGVLFKDEVQINCSINGMKWGILSINEVQINRSRDEMKCASEKMCGRSG